MKKIFRIIYIIIFLLAGIFVLLHPAKTETNILNAVFSKNFADSTIVKLSNRYSSKINVIIESDDFQKISEAAEKFQQKLDKNIFTTENIDVSQIIENYKKYHNNLLSDQNIKRLENDYYDIVEAKALEELYNPLTVMLLPLDKDPFLLFTDYIKSLSSEGKDLSSLSFNDKYYKVITLNVQHDLALSPSKVNQEIKKLVKTQKELSKNGVSIYLTGTPIHSYYASSKSMFEINLICIISTLFLFGLFRLYFSNLKLIIPTGVSLLCGMAAGYILTTLIFHSIHVLTFVFSTTLIGICIDYSLHYFIEKDLDKIFKSLTVSMITTVSAFAVLLFSGVELLRQISVFTIAGLFNVYLIVVLFYPLLKFNAVNNHIAFSLGENSKKMILYTIIGISFCGLFFIKFNDDIKDMYVPSKKLVAAENLFQDITGKSSKTTFAIIRGENLQDILEKEETLTKELSQTKFQALSKFIPSHKQQAKNRELIKNLYEHSLSNYALFLNKTQINELINKKFSEDYLDLDTNNKIFSEFLLDDKTSIIVLYDIQNPQIITDNGYEYIDVRENVSNKIKTCRINCMVTILPIFILLFVLLSFIYKPKKTIKIITPSVLASVFSLSLLSILGISINLFHVLAIFLIIGFGLDYSVFRASGLQGSKDAVLLSNLTTVFSFVLLSLTSFKLISSLGFILSIGLFISYLTSLLFDYDEKGNT